MNARLVVSGVSKCFGPTTILDRVDLSVGAGEVMALTGENGAGKSTLLRICAGVLACDAGVVRADTPIGYCPQEAGLFELLTAGTGFSPSSATRYTNASSSAISPAVRARSSTWRSRCFRTRLFCFSTSRTRDSTTAPT